MLMSLFFGIFYFLLSYMCACTGKQIVCSCLFPDRINFSLLIIAALSFFNRDSFWVQDEPISFFKEGLMKKQGLLSIFLKNPTLSAIIVVSITIRKLEIYDYY